MVTQMTIQSYEHHSTRFKQMVGQKAVLKTTGETVTIIDRAYGWPFCVTHDKWTVEYQEPNEWKTQIFNEQVMDVKY